MSDINQSQCTPEGDKTPNLTDLFSENDNNSNSNRLDNIYLTWEQNENSSSNMNTSSANNSNNNNFNNFNIGNIINPQKKRRKYDPDCLRKKIKFLVLKYSLEFINYKIMKLLHKKNVVKKIVDKQTKTTNITFERQFMYKTLEEIFSTKISKKYTNIINPGKYNKNKITGLKSQKDLKNIFNIRFIECLNHFFGINNLEELNGMKTIEDIHFKEEKYKDCVIYYAKNYEENVLRARPRNNN